MNKNALSEQKQTLQDVLSGEEPTEEFLEEFRMLEEAEDIPDIELERQAIAVKLEEENVTTRATELDYKTKESNFSAILILFMFLIAIYWFSQ